VYICEGCDIGTSLNVDELVDYAKKGKLANICPVVKKSGVLCSPEGKAEIEADIAANGLDGVVLCACSPRVKWDIFNFGPAVQVERVNLREHCVWSFQDDPKVPNQLPLIAKDYVRMGMMKLSKSRIPAPEVPETFQTIMVLGGGFTGLTAAIEAAKLGRELVLVEKAGVLGGKAATMYKSFPLSAPYTQTEDTGIGALIDAVNASPKIKVLLNAELVSLEGAPGLYTATLNAGGEQKLEIGAVVLATGWVAGDMNYLAPMGYGSIKNVVTAAEFEAMVKAGEIKRPSDGKAPDSVAILTDVSLCTAAAPAEEPCAEGEAAPAEAAPAEGEAEAPAYPSKESAKHLAYSSELTSLVALKHARYVREKLPQAMAYVLYDHMIVPGINERYYNAAQDEAGVMLSNQHHRRHRGFRRRVLVRPRNTLLGADIEIKPTLWCCPRRGARHRARGDHELPYRRAPLPGSDLFRRLRGLELHRFPTRPAAPACTRRLRAPAHDHGHRPRGRGRSRARPCSASAPPTAAWPCTPERPT
jgi:quinone-modifying oxidoreductase subunit QmoB